MSGPAALGFVPVIIIGAGRSGTNALRDAMVRLPGFTTWPCDEIDAIWRYGNGGHPDDRFSAGHAGPRVRRYIRGAFARQWKRGGRVRFVVEKTCANSLRVPFIDAVLPEARFVLIQRDGRAVVASARKRWRGELEMPGLPYLLAKARFVPLASLPGTAWRWFARRLPGRSRQDGRLRWWGPRMPGHAGLKDAPLDVICAHQWAACVETAQADLDLVAPDRVLRLSYEALSRDPAGTLSRIVAFLGAAVTDADLTAAAAVIRPDQGSATRRPPAQIDPAALDIMAPLQRRLGYIA